ncbi:MAG: insulinase family protein [Pyrinomonadaceae bacterium]|nr:insulinase family protein [Phycisphaerales bacterium]
MHTSTLSLLAGSLVSIALAPTALAQNVPVEKYVLPNGMKVILHEDKSLPIATINIWYSVGAQDEPKGRSGFAHLFEHLMFMGTKRVPGNDFDVLMETGGGANNANTDLHRTDYFSSGPSSLLPTLLWLDADRLEDMGLNMTKDKVDKQRDVVRNELRQVVENAPYGKADELLWPMLFAPTHPYYTGVIGTHEDLEAANVTNVKDFFANFYVPNNASLVVAGDFDPAQIKPLIASLFGSLPRGADVPRKYTRPSEPIPITISGVKRATAIDAVELPRVQYTYMSPVSYGPGDAEMRLASMVLAEGKASRLYKRLVIDEKLAAEVAASQNSYPLASFFQINILTKPDADLDKVEKIVDEELAKFAQTGPTAAELERNKATMELAMLSQVQSIARKATMLNEYEAAWGEPNSFKRDLDRYRNATTDAVRTWSSQVLTPGARIITRVLPEEPTRAESPRDKRPADALATPFSAPTPTNFTLSNGMKVMLWTRKDLPLVAMNLLVTSKASLDPAGKEGVHELAAQMLSEGAGDLDALAFENAVQELGGNFGAGADEESLSASFTVLKRNLGKGVHLFGDAILRPRMQPTEFDRVKSLHLDDLRQADENAALIANKIGDLVLYGSTNPYATSPAGTVASVSSLSLDDVKSAARAVLQPDAAIMLVAGDVTEAELKGLLEESFKSWTRTADAPKRTDDFSIPAVNGMKLVIVDKPGATQTVVRFVAPGVKFDTPDRVKLHLLNTLLGGSFTSRLNQNLRETHGYTYGARSSFAQHRSTGAFTAGARVQAQVTGAALKEFSNEFTRLKAGDVTDAEVAKARETFANDTVESFSGLNGLLSAAGVRLENGLPFESIARDVAQSTTVTAAELNTLGKLTIERLDHGALILVGDKGLILEQIKDLQLPAPIIMDADGNLVK